MEIQNAKILSEGEELELSDQTENFDIRSLEKSKDLNYKVLKWKSEPEKINFLLQLQTVITEHLPQLSSQYIHRMMTDKNHYNLVMTLNGQVIGGSCIRVFKQQLLAQIVFFAIDQHYQNKGFGRRLMDILKDFLKNQKIKYALAFADHLAINFFKKQGFTKNITVDKSIWKNLIKQYSGSSMMQFAISSETNYLIMDQILDGKKKYFNSKIQNNCLKRLRLKRKLNSIFKLRTGFLAPLPHVPVQVWLPKQYPGFEDYNLFSKANINQTKFKKISILQLCKDLIFEILNQSQTQVFQFDRYFYTKIPESENLFKDVNYFTLWKKLQNDQYLSLNEFINDLHSFLFMIEDKSYNEQKKKSAKKLREFVYEKIQNLRYLESILSEKQASFSRIEQE